VVRAEPYFIVALPVLKVKFAWYQYSDSMPKPETLSRLCTKCHSKTLHEVREKTAAGIKLVCTDCGNVQTVTGM
jgi:hypothetical protein